MSDNTFKFYLKSNDTTFFHVANGSVVQTDVKTEVVSSVNDWANAQISFKRNDTYWTAFREYSVPMKFVLDGAKILRSIYYTEGFTGKCIFYIEKLNRTTRQYEYWFDGDIDFSQSVDQDNYFQVNLMERGLIGLIRNREDVEYEIPLTGPDVVSGRLEGVKLGAKSSWVLGDSISDDGSFPPLVHTSVAATNLPNTVLGGEIFMTTQFGSDIQAGDFIIPRDQEYGYFQHNNIDTLAFSAKRSTLRNTAQWFDVNFSGKLQIAVNIQASSSPVGTQTFQVDLCIGATSNAGVRLASKNILVGQSPIMANNTWYDFGIPINGYLSDLEEGCSVYIYTRFKQVSGENAAATIRSVYYTNTATMSINYRAMVTPTVYSGLRLVDLFKRLVDKCTDGQYSAVSSFLSNSTNYSAQRAANFDNAPYLTIATSGNALRGLPESTIKTSIKEFHRTVWAEYGLCLSIEGNTVRMEPLSYYFSDDVLLHVGLINSVQIKTYVDKVVNRVSVGYASYDNNNVEGKNEFNTGLKFLIKENTVINKEEDIVSPYRADVYGIESVRAETFDQDKKDNRSDNDTFLIEVDQTPVSGFLVPYRPLGSVITGVDDPVGIYNVSLSPKRSLYRHLPRLRSIVKKGILEFQTSDENPDLISNLGSGTIAETANVDLTLNTAFGNSVLPLFQPIVIEFDCAPPYNLAEILGLQTKGCISFDHMGTTFKGFILDVGCTPATNDKYNFKLLSHPGNDLSKLIH